MAQFNKHLLYNLAFETNKFWHWMQGESKETKKDSKRFWFSGVNVTVVWAVIEHWTENQLTINNC